jgi:hypothetical protein
MIFPGTLPVCFHKDGHAHLSLHDVTARSVHRHNSPVRDLMSAAPPERTSFIATGEFDVKIAPPDMIPVPTNAPAIGRHILEKTYHGGLNGRSLGQMLSAGQLQQGQATYVALESFEGALDGRSGGFALAHFGEMDTGSEELRIRIVPGSGTGELSGIRGQLQIRREAGKHFYTLTYWTA